MLFEKLHINKHLDVLTKDPDIGFEIIFSHLQTEYKDDHKKLLIYLDKIINKAIE